MCVKIEKKSSAFAYIDLVNNYLGMSLQNIKLVQMIR